LASELRAKSRAQPPAARHGGPDDQENDLWVTVVSVCRLVRMILVGDSPAAAFQEGNESGDHASTGPGDDFFAASEARWERY
jgi:hypothetical protein